MKIIIPDEIGKTLGVKRTGALEFPFSEGRKYTKKCPIIVTNNNK